jgi:2-polyprenyl-6-methoxyphenol hydroxylase-like FAD-dependent oxidoreductase
VRVLISGAGIAGLTVAYWLRRYGFIATIVERAPSLLTGGYKIDVRGTALQVLRRMGIHDAVVAASTDMQGALLVDKDGKVINEMSGDAFGHRVGDDLEIVRGTLCQILMDHISDAEFIFGDSIQVISQSSDGVRVEFTKNSPREFDLVIGADGLHSNVRRIVFGDESRFVRDLGLYLCVYTVPNYLKLDRMEIQCSELGRVAAIWSSRGDANAKACFGFTAPSARVDLRDRARQQQVLTNTYAGIGWVWLTGPKVELCWRGTPAIAPHPCLVKARVSHSLVPMCWLENWLRHPGTTKLRFINMKRRCVPSLRSTRRSGSNLQT